MDVVAWVRCVVLVALFLAVAPPALFGVGVNAEPGNEAVLRIEERLTTDREFYDQWIHLVELQARLGLEQRRDYPAEPESTLEACDNSAAISEDHADNLRPVDIEMFAEMGHLSAYCEHNLTALSSGHLDHCAHRTRESSLPSLLRYLRVFNPHLIHVHSNDLRTSLSEQARAISESMKRQPNYGDRWKMIVIAASIQDGEASETGQTAVEVLDTIEELNRLLPHRTFIVAVRTSGSGLWQDASHSHAACRAMLSRWKLHSQFNMESVWDQVNLITERNFQTPNFTVEILPLLKRPQLINLPESMDLSALGYDCAHMSEFGLAALQQEIWNSLFTLPNERSEDFRPLPKNLICPAKNCPFFRTGRNSAVCVWNPIEITDDDDTIRKLIVIAALLVALILTCIVICILCCYRNRKDYKKPLNPFGYDLDSIKFIDEDVN